jgi:branched-chain amino acid transport system permease protein
MFRQKTVVDKVRENLLGVIVLLILALLPMRANDFLLDTLVRTYIFVILAVTLDFFSGTTGYLNLGHSFIFGLSAYLTGILYVYLKIPTEIAILGAGLLGTFGSLALLLPSLRVRGVYFAILSLLYPIIFIGIVTTQPFSLYLGGEGGLRIKQLFLDIARKLPPSERLAFLHNAYYYLSFILMVASFIVLYKLAYNEFGFKLRSIGQDEELSEAAGVNTTNMKIKGFLLSAVFASYAGALYAGMRPPITVDFVNTGSILLPTLTAMIVGGAGTIIGPAIAAFLLTLLYQYLWGLVGLWRTVAYMIILLAFVLIRPQGIFFDIYLRIRRLVDKVIR